jgi:biofilm PGA synthesis N-glycosyltransferase PgaC
MAQGKLMLWLLIIPLIPYFLFLIYIFRGLFLNKLLKRETKNDIKVSVVVACRDEEENLSFLLNDLIAQDYPSDLYEVIVVDDHSIDNTASIASSFYNNGTLKVLRNSGIGKKSAIRTGIIAAKGDFILTTDADCRLKKSWISSMASFYSENKPDLVIGPVYLIERTGFLPQFQALEFFSLQGVTAGSAGMGVPVMCNGANLAFPTEIYKKYSGKLHKEIASGDDLFLLHRIKADKGKILWNGNNDALVETKASISIKSFLRQRGRWISKSGSYEDRFTQILAIITLLANIDLAFLAAGSIVIPGMIDIYLAAFLIKSIPDFLIVSTMAGGYNKRNLLWWFIPSQVIYPFYVITVSVYSLFRRNKW